MTTGQAASPPSHRRFGELPMAIERDGQAVWALCESIFVACDICQAGGHLRAVRRPAATAGPAIAVVRISGCAKALVAPAMPEKRYQFAGALHWLRLRWPDEYRYEFIGHARSIASN